MKAVFPVVMTGILSIASVSNANKECSAYFDPNGLKIHDLLGTRNPSKLKENYKAQLATVFQTIEHHYGVLGSKLGHPYALGPQTKATPSIKIDWNIWNGLKRDNLKAASTLETTNDQYYSIASFLAKFNDAHVSVQIPSSLSWKLPLQIQLVEDKLVVAFISGKYPSALKQPEIGDELIAINGKSVEEAQKELPSFNDSGNPLSSKSMFALRLTRWSEASGLPLSKMNRKDVELTFSSHQDPTETYTVRIPYEIEGTGLIGKDVDGKDPNPTVIFSPEAPVEKDPSEQLAPSTTSILRMAHKLFRTEIPYIKRDLGPSASETGKGKKLEIGGFKPFFKLPPDFKPIVLPHEVVLDPKFSTFFSNKTFFAGTFEKNGKRVGLLRIPAYSAEKVAAIATTIRFYMGRLQAESDYLIIDQTDNPGGMVIMSDMILKALAGRYIPENHMRFAVKPSQNFLRQYRELRDGIALNEDKLFTKAEVKEIVAKLDVEYEKIYRAFINGDDLSEPVSMLAISEYAERSFDKALFKLPWGPLFKKLVGVDIQKHQTYKNPSRFIISENDYSGGDATAAQYQDYGLGYLIGTHAFTQTGGAGGTVETFQFRGWLEFTATITTSAMVRKGGYLVENSGVRSNPKHNVPRTRQDVIDGDANYLNRLVESIENSWTPKEKEQIEKSVKRRHQKH